MKARTEELTSMVRAAGSIGLRYLRARWLRARSERWARQIIREARQGGWYGAVAAIAGHENASGEALSEETAAVELINLLRPTVAVGVYVTFAAHALHLHGTELRNFLDADSEDPARVMAVAVAVADEVRRFYPFFPAIGGRVISPFEWRGHRFGEDDWLLLDLYGTNHDPLVWDEPGRFDPARHFSRDSASDGLVPQGGGDHALGHRCPGEWLTVALLAKAIICLIELDYNVPEQSLDISLNNFPTGPREGMRISVAPPVSS